MAAVRGTIHDNPWAGVEPPPSGDHDHPDEDGDETRRRRRGTMMILKEGLMLQTLDVTIQILLCLDGCLGIFFLVFGLVLHHKHPGSVYAVVWTLVLGNFLIFRAKGVAMGLFLPTDSLFSCCRGGLTVAAHLSVGLAVFFGGCAILGLAFRPNVRHYLQTTELDLTQSQSEYLVNHYTAIIVILAVSAVLEGAKFLMYKVYRRSILVLEEEEERREEQTLIRREAATGRPWWWSHSTVSRHGRRRNNNGDTDLTESLLDEREEQRHPPRRRFFFLWPRRRANVDPLRDDGSVDFASVQEEWASRAEEDPVWWSREDEVGVEAHSPSRSKEVDTSWANDTSQV